MVATALATATSMANSIEALLRRHGAGHSAEALTVRAVRRALEAERPSEPEGWLRSQRKTIQAALCDAVQRIDGTAHFSSDPRMHPQATSIHLRLIPHTKALESQISQRHGRPGFLSLRLASHHTVGACLVLLQRKYGISPSAVAGKAVINSGSECTLVIAPGRACAPSRCVDVGEAHLPVVIALEGVLASAGTPTVVFYQLEFGRSRATGQEGARPSSPPSPPPLGTRRRAQQALQHRPKVPRRATHDSDEQFGDFPFPVILHPSRLQSTTVAGWRTTSSSARL